MKRNIWIAILAALLLLPVSCSKDAPPQTDDHSHEQPQQPQEPDEPEESDEDDGVLSILFIGNSFTMDSVTHLPGMVDAAGISDLHMVHMYYGGRLISQYYKGWETSSDYKKYECAPREKKWTQTQNQNLSVVAKSREWDIVVIQEHTGNKNAWTWNADALGNFSGLVQCINSSQKKAPKIYYILSQAYSDMSKIGSTSRPSVTWTDHEGMWQVVSSFGKQVMETFKFDGIISTGAMLENLRTSSLNNGMNLTRDGYHMDNGLARYGASCTVFETILTPIYEISLENNSYRYNKSSTESGKYTTAVTDSSAPIALQAARFAIADPYRITDMSEY